MATHSEIAALEKIVSEQKKRLEEANNQEDHFKKFIRNPPSLLKMAASVALGCTVYLHTREISSGQDISQLLHSNSDIILSMIDTSAGAGMFLGYISFGLAFLRYSPPRLPIEEIKQDLLRAESNLQGVIEDYNFSRGYNMPIKS